MMKPADLRPNDNNPRTITEAKFKQLVKSLREFPSMMHARPIVCDENLVVFGGNMRLRALMEIGAEEVPVCVVEGWSQEQKDEFVIKDNIGFGVWDWETLANEWNDDLLEDWGLDFPKFGDLPVMEGSRDNTHHDTDKFLDSGIVRFQLLYSDEEAQRVKDWFDKQMAATETDNYSDCVMALVDANH